ncbi:MAG: CAP domain-containing protein [bacterium]|nr:CAP domain-containing protein [bacterium]
MFATVKKLFIPCRDNNFRPKILEGKYLVYILLLACFLRLSTFLFFWQLPNTSFFADISRVVLIDSLNDERTDLKLGTLKENTSLNKAALLKANDMMQKGYFSHTSPAGITPWYWFKKVGYDYKSAGENLGIGFVDSSELHQAWNNSPSHKANLISKNYKDIGISFLKGSFQGSPTTIVVQLFGAPRIIPVLKPKTPVIVKPIATTTITTNIFGSTANSNLSTTASGVVAGDFISVEEERTFLEKVLEFFAKDYNSLTQKIVWGFLIINIIALILNIVIKIFVQHYDLILKASLISLALILLLAVGPKEITSLLNPYVSIF